MRLSQHVVAMNHGYRRFRKGLELTRALQANGMGIQIFAFLSESYILEKNSKVPYVLNSKYCESMNNLEIKKYKTVL